MDGKCRKWSRWVPPCAVGQPLASEPPHAPVEKTPGALATQGGIAFGAPEPAVLLGTGPRFDMPGPMMNTVRDAALSLAAQSGVDPVGPVMVEVTPVMPDSATLQVQALAGWRIGFADRYVAGEAQPFPPSGAYLLQALDTLRQAGAHLVPVAARLADQDLHFTLESDNEIDQRVTEHRLDALVSDEHSRAFHTACKAGYPGISVANEAGALIWFYGPRWGRDSLGVLVKAYRQTLATTV